MGESLGRGRGEPITAPSHFPSHLLPWMCLGLWLGAISKCATDSWSQAGLSKVFTSLIFSDLPGRSCSQSPGQTPPILGKQMYTIALSLSIRFYHSFQQARNRRTIQLPVARRWGWGGILCGRLSLAVILLLFTFIKLTSLHHPRCVSESWERMKLDSALGINNASPHFLCQVHDADCH